MLYNVLMSWVQSLIMPKIELSDVKLEDEYEHELTIGLLGYDATFGHSAALGAVQPHVQYITRVYVGKDRAGKKVNFTLPQRLEDGCRVRLDYGGLLNLIIRVGNIDIDGKNHCIGACDVLKG